MHVPSIKFQARSSKLAWASNAYSFPYANVIETNVHLPKNIMWLTLDRGLLPQSWLVGFLSHRAVVAEASCNGCTVPN